MWPGVACDYGHIIIISGWETVGLNTSWQTLHYLSISSDSAIMPDTEMSIGVRTLVNPDYGMQLMIGAWHIVGNEPMCFTTQIFFTKFCDRQEVQPNVLLIISAGSLCIEFNIKIRISWCLQVSQDVCYVSWPQTEDDDQIFNYSLATESRRQLACIICMQGWSGVWWPILLMFYITYNQYITHFTASDNNQPISWSDGHILGHTVKHSVILSEVLL